MNYNEFDQFWQNFSQTTMAPTFNFSNFQEPVYGRKINVLEIYVGSEWHLNITMTRPRPMIHYYTILYIFGRTTHNNVQFSMQFSHGESALLSVPWNMSEHNTEILINPLTESICTWKAQVSRGFLKKC